MRLRYFYRPVWGYIKEDKMYYQRDIQKVLHYSESSKTVKDDEAEWYPIETEDFPNIEKQKELFEKYKPKGLIT